MRRNRDTKGNGDVMRNRTRGGESRRRAHTTPWTWVLLAAIVAAALATGACALWLPDRAPSVLGEARVVQSAPASAQQYAGQQQVNLVPTVSGDRELLGNAGGVVTDNWANGSLRSGSRTYQVNDRAVVALHTATPLYRDLKTGDRGEDVLALNNELNRLGYSSAAESDTFNWATGQGWRQLMIDNGNAPGDGEEVTMALADTLWIPQDVVDVANWTAQQGTNVTAGAAVGVVPGGLTKLTIRGGQPSDKDRTITVYGVTSTLPAGSVDVTDAETLRQIAATESYQSKSAEERAAGIDATVTLSDPIDTLRVPAAAVFAVDGSSGCIAVDEAGKATSIPVEIISGELGASLVRPDSGGTDGITQVIVGPRLNALGCK